MTDSPTPAGTWRVGRKVGRTIYRQVGSDPVDGDGLIGVMDTRELAEQAVTAHNDFGTLLAALDALMVFLEAIVHENGANDHVWLVVNATKHLAELAKHRERR